MYKGFHHVVFLWEIVRSETTRSGPTAEVAEG